MGVRGLTTYINYNQDSFLQAHLLHNCNLVIDGHSLCAQLYGRLRCFSAFGGDYDKFAAFTKNFFKALSKCRVTPYVIFDGSYEKKKLKTAFNRLRSKIHGASRLDPVTQNSLKIFPLLLRDVFKEVLSEMNISYTICEFEADSEIAALAKHLSCPVLSYDSDFFVYNVLYIPFNTLDCKPIQIDENGLKTYALECKIYRVQHMLENFGGLKEDLLPLLATILGNDYVEKKVFNKFFTHLKLPKSKKKMNEQQKCIHGIFKWLQNETLDSAIAKILGRLKKDQKKKVLAIINKSIDSYNRKSCRSLKYFNMEDKNIWDADLILSIEDSDDEKIFEDEVDVKNDISSNNSSGTSEENSDVELDSPYQHGDDPDFLINSIPDWFSECIRNNTVPQCYINLYTHQLHFCSPQAEDYNEEDSFLQTLPIMKYSFDMLTDYNYESCTYVSRENDSNYRKIIVGREYSTPRLIDKPFPEMSQAELHLCFEHFLKYKLSMIDLNIVKLLPENFQLFMLSILWWVCYCKVPAAHAHSIFVCYIMLDIIDEKTGTYRSHFSFHNKYSKKINELKRRNPVTINIDDLNLFLNKNKVLYEDCIVAANFLLKHFEIDESICKRPKSYDSSKMHSFAQLQCCLQQFNSLNTLCGSPFATTNYSKCYNGTFLYNIALKLENQIEPMNYLMQYLSGADTVLMFYKSLCFVYEKCLKAMNLSHVAVVNKKRRRRKKVAQNDVDKIMEQFQFEVVI